MNTMDPKFNNLSHSADNSFDRLVDGELSESERRQLLASLDREPEGWRRCALAFLEAQSWKKEIGALRQTVPAGSLKVASLAGPARQKTSPQKVLGTILAMAASFLLVLGAGIWWQRGERNIVVATATAPINQFAGKIGDQAATKSMSRPEKASIPWKLVRLSPAGSTNPNQDIELPAVERDRIDEQWLKSMPSAVPKNVVQALRRSGYQVQTNEELMPMVLKDGRRLVVPIDQVDVKYVGNRIY
jgi:hypothetical protein